MKNIKSYILTIMAMTALTACQKKPVADFIMSKTVAEVGESVLFTSISSNAYSLMWSFGDGSFSSVATDYHTFNAPGSFPVKLTVYSENGKKSDEITKIITITQPVVTGMMVPTSGSSTFTTCSGILYDNGGPNGNYSNDVSGNAILYPATPNKKIRVNGTLKCESSFDYLYIINGNSENGTILWSGSGYKTIPDITSTAANGALCIRFVSDDSVTDEGFAISISCVD